VLAGFAWRMLRARGDLEEFGRRLGAWAVHRAEAGRTPSLAERYDAIRERLPVLEWAADGRLVVTAVDVGSGALRCFSGADDVSLLDAVTASCAVPGVYPPVPIGGRTYVDGGARSGSNADLTASCTRVVALTPVDRAVGPMRSATQQLAGLRHVVVSPDETAVNAIGRNVLDLAHRAASARAGRMQAESVAEEIGALWGAP
jgi:NTE family protein